MGGGVSPDTFTANWLPFRGGRGGVSLDTFTGKGCTVRGGRGGVRADTRLPLAMSCDTSPPCPSAASLRCPWRAPRVVCMHVCMHVCMYVCMYGAQTYVMYVYVYIYICVYIYMCKYMYLKSVHFVKYFEGRISRKRIRSPSRRPWIHLEDQTGHKVRALFHLDHSSKSCAIFVG